MKPVNQLLTVIDSYCRQALPQGLLLTVNNVNNVNNWRFYLAIGLPLALTLAYLRLFTVIYGYLRSEP